MENLVGENENLVEDVNCATCEDCETETVRLEEFRNTIVAESLEDAMNKFMELNPEINIFEFENKTSKFKSKKFDEDMEVEMDKLIYPKGYVVILQKPILNTNKIRSSVNSFKQDGTRNWTTTFRICYMTTEGIRPIPNSFPFTNKKEAVLAARDWTGENKVKSYIKVTKELLHPDDTVIVSEIDYKPSKNERMGTFLFFGKH